MRTHAPYAATMHRTSHAGKQAGLVKRWAAAVLVCVSPAVQAALSAPDRLAALSVPGFTWQPQRAINMSGVPIYIKGFDSPDPLVQAAQALAEHSGLFQRVLKIDDKVVLSGLQADWHWLAEVDAAQPGARGYVSALYVAGADAAGTFGQDPSFAWLPHQAQRQFDYRSGEGGKQVVQQIYSVPMTVQALAAHVHGQLLSRGWAAEPGPAGVRGSSTWRLGEARLILYPLQGAAGTSLYLHYTE